MEMSYSAMQEKYGRPPELSPTAKTDDLTEKRLKEISTRVGELQLFLKSLPRSTDGQMSAGEKSMRQEMLALGEERKQLKESLSNNKEN